MENKLKIIDAETLLATPMAKTLYVVDGLVPQGVNIICGDGKIGKSWLMLWLGLQVSQGLPVWGFETLHCDVLYLSLEDTVRRIKDRLYKLTDTAPTNLRFAVACSLLGCGLENQIKEHLAEYPKTKLIIIDTLQKVRDSRSANGKAGMYSSDYDDISSIKRQPPKTDIIAKSDTAHNTENTLKMKAWRMGLFRRLLIVSRLGNMFFGKINCALNPCNPIHSLPRSVYLNYS